MKYEIDEAEFTPLLAVCCECDWRGMAESREAALKRLAIHEEFVHPRTHNVRANYRKVKSRRVAAMKKPGQPPKKGSAPKSRQA